MRWGWEKVRVGMRWGWEKGEDGYEVRMGEG